jgi:hypothetical protein
MLAMRDRGHATDQRSFRVGRDREGHWVAVESTGMNGGIFASREAALHYAATETERRPGAVSISPAPVDLKI